MFNGVSKSYRKNRKKFKLWFFIRSFKNRGLPQKKSIIGNLDPYLSQKTLDPFPKFQYFRRFRQIPQVIYGDFAEGIISKLV